jgi:glycine/D-amino acid oxidase-like deaminating enzyme
MTERYEVAVVGAGPNGLSVAAHLRHYGGRRRLRPSLNGQCSNRWNDLPVGEESRDGGRRLSPSSG